MPEYETYVMPNGKDGFLEPGHRKMPPELPGSYKIRGTLQGVLHVLPEREIVVWWSPPRGPKHPYGEWVCKTEAALNFIRPTDLEVVECPGTPLGANHDHESRFTIDDLILYLVKYGTFLRLALMMGHTVNEEGLLHSSVNADWGICIETFMVTLYISLAGRTPPPAVIERMRLLKGKNARGMGRFFKDSDSRATAPQKDRDFKLKFEWLVKFLGSRALVKRLPTFKDGYGDLFAIHDLASHIERDHYGAGLYDLIRARSETRKFLFLNSLPQ